MKKILKCTLVVLIMLNMVIIITGCGKKDNDKKEYNKDNETVVNQAENNSVNESKSNEENQNVVENKSKENSVDNKTTKSKSAFSKEDLVINGFSLGESVKALEGIYEETPETKTYTQDATGTTITELNYKSIGLIVFNEFENEEDSEGNITSIKIYGNSKIQTARKIKIGSSKQDILNAYPSDSILKNDSKVIIVGYPGSDPEYGSTNKYGNIYYNLENGKVSSILLAYAVAE